MNKISPVLFCGYPDRSARAVFLLLPNGHGYSAWTNFEHLVKSQATHWETFKLFFVRFVDESLDIL